MNKDRKHSLDILVNIYNMSYQEIEKMSNMKLTKLVRQKEEEAIALSQNPNKFWYIKGMPVPKKHEIKTSKIWGAVIVAMLFLALLGFLIMFFVMAYTS